MPSHAHMSPNTTEAYSYGLIKQGLPSEQPRQPNWDIVSQPKSSPLIQEQFGAEVKDVCTGLVMVEAKCINLDNARAADPSTEVSKEDWQTLIALHRTLLYEHHDFLMATQHTNANPALRGLVSKYCMPARMWKHGNHAFLEVLRHRRPQSQEYMLTFIYLAYQMMGLLLRTTPNYLDTWIECLGNLARYRMAIEEDKETHAVWCSVAARWYQMAADRHPRSGRLYHHLGILERPSLRKFCFYARSLTSVTPFLNAAESLNTMCTSILQDDEAIRCGTHGAEAVTICFHARVFTAQSTGVAQSLELIAQDGHDALKLLKEQSSGKIASYSVALAVTNIAGLLPYGLEENVFHTMYAKALAKEAHDARPSVQDSELLPEAAKAITANGVNQVTAQLDAVMTFWSSCFNTVIENELNQATLRDLMQYVHANLVWLSSLINLRSRLRNPALLKVINDHFDRIHWAKLATFLNAISQIDPITQRVEEHAVHNVFSISDQLVERRPLVEDYMLRGNFWAENYPSPELFYDIGDNDKSRTIDTPARLHLRAERVLWLSCRIAQPDLKYDSEGMRQISKPHVKPWPSKHFESSTDSAPYIAMIADGLEISAFPDSGSGANFMSYSYAIERSLEVVSSNSRSYVKPDGSLGKSMGTVTITMKFAGEDKSHSVVCHVLATCFHKLVLGASFLAATDTLSVHFYTRIRRTLRTVASTLCVQYAGSLSFVSGTINGENVVAQSDTGSNVMLISNHYATKRGFKIRRDPQWCKKLEFIDGSTALTCGTVEGLVWRYSCERSMTFTCNFLVLDGLPCDVLLSFNFLYETDCFRRYVDCAYVSASSTHQLPINTVRLLPKAVIRCATAPGSTPSEPSKQELLSKYETACQQAQTLSLDQQKAILEPQQKHYQALMRLDEKSAK